MSEHCNHPKYQKLAKKIENVTGWECEEGNRNYVPGSTETEQALLKVKCILKLKTETTNIPTTAFSTESWMPILPVNIYFFITYSNRLPKSRICNQVQTAIWL